MTITLTREEAQQVLDALSKGIRRNDWKIVCDAHNEMKMRLAQPKPEYRDVVIAGDLWRIEFLPDHAASVVLVKANYEAQPEPELVAWRDCVAGLAEARLCKSWCGNFNCSATEPQRKEWQGLTDEEIMDLCAAQWASHPIDIGRIIEAKLKEKNT
jgi:hypothetical protein